MLLLLSNTNDRFTAGKRILKTGHCVSECYSLSSSLKGCLSKSLSIAVVRGDFNDHRLCRVLNNPLSNLLDDFRILTASSSHALLVHTMRARKV